MIHKLSYVNAALECLNLHAAKRAGKNGGKSSNQHRENPDIGSSWRWNLGAARWWWRVGVSKGAGGWRARVSRPPSRSPPDPRGWGWGAGWTHPRPVPGGRGSPHAATGILKVLLNVLYDEIFDKFSHYNLKRHNHHAENSDICRSKRFMIRTDKNMNMSWPVFQK